MLGRELLAARSDRGREQADPDLLNAVFRAAHSLKGLSAMFGLDGIAGLAHRAEDVLDALRLGKVQATDQRCSTRWSETVDVLQALLRRGRRAGEDSGSYARGPSAMAARLQRGRWRAAPPTPPTCSTRWASSRQVRAVFTEYEEHRLRENVKKGVGLWKVRAVFSLDDFDRRLARLNAALKPLGEVISTLPSSQPGDDALHRLRSDLRQRTQPEAELEQAIASGATLAPADRACGCPPPPPAAPGRRPEGRRQWDDPSARRRPRPLVSSPSGLTRARRLRAAACAASPTRCASTSSRLDGLMNSIGELLLIRSNIEKLAEAAPPGLRRPRCPSCGARSCSARCAPSSAGSTSCRRACSTCAWCPLGQVFDKLARLMRRLVRESGKDVVFEVLRRRRRARQAHRRGAVATR